MSTIKKTITSEDPNIHWDMLPVRGKVVLDLGSGIWDHSLPTPMYFLQQGASKVIGVDASTQSYDWFKQNLNHPTFIQHMDMIDSTQKFELFLGHYRPDVVKCDVEGGEIYLNSLDPSYLTSVTNMAIEYHNLATKLVSESILKNNGYIISYYDFTGINSDNQGVIYGYRPDDFYNKPTDYVTQ